MEQQHQSSIAYLITMEVQQCHYFTTNFKTKLWGGQRLSEFGYQLDNDTTGECWCVSAHPNGTSEIINGPYQGQTLDRIWSEHRELFGDFPSKDFPLLTKIVDARESLSIHVHPDNSYAYEHENGQYGKSECWYIIDAEEDAEIVIGTLAESREEVANHVQHGTIESILRYIKVKPENSILFQQEQYILFLQEY